MLLFHLFMLFGPLGFGVALVFVAGFVTLVEEVMNPKKPRR